MSRYDWALELLLYCIVLYYAEDECIMTVSTDRLGILFFDVILQFPLSRSSRSLLQPDAKLLPLFDGHHDSYHDDNDIHFT